MKNEKFTFEYPGNRHKQSNLYINKVYHIPSEKYINNIKLYDLIIQLLLENQQMNDVIKSQPEMVKNKLKQNKNK